MSVVLLVLPDFLIIAMGWILRNKAGFSREFFVGLEKLVYYLLFPSLLFMSILRIPISASDALDTLIATSLICLTGIVGSWLAAPLFKPPPLLMASCAQCGFRFNTYMGLALAPSLAGSAGQSSMALIIGFAVPIVNLAAVYALARHHGTNVLGALLRNPLLMSTLLGLMANLAGLKMPVPIDILLTRLGSASVPIGILCVGASLSWQSAQGSLPVMAWVVGVKLLLMPAAAWVIATVMNLDSIKTQMMVLFASLPTASAAYVLAVRMGGDGRMVGVTITIATLLSAVTIPLWLLLVT